MSCYELSFKICDSWILCVSNEPKSFYVVSQTFRFIVTRPYWHKIDPYLVIYAPLYVSLTVNSWSTNLQPVNGALKWFSSGLQQSVFACFSFSVWLLWEIRMIHLAFRLHAALGGRYQWFMYWLFQLAEGIELQEKPQWWQDKYWLNHAMKSSMQKAASQDEWGLDSIIITTTQIDPNQNDFCETVCCGVFFTWVSLQMRSDFPAFCCVI